ncbi:MAG: hypothetical protein IKY93_00985 [Alistipes sp.]|nr:hypothetical protein [Alistipes sp.]
MYPLEVIICSGALYGFYRLVLEGRVAHRTARWFLTLSILLAIVVPLLELPILPAVEDSYVEIPIDKSIAVAESAEIATSTTTANGLNWITILLAIYAAVTAIMVVRFVVGIIKIQLLRRRSLIERNGGYSIAVNCSITKPFSFWKTIFIGSIHKDINHILLHEKSHISHNHTIEKLVIEALRCTMWFNPFIHLTALSLSQVQEWEADSDVLNQGVDIDQYRKTIFHQLFGYTPDITCGLNNNLTKKRFIMMTQSKRGRYPLLRICAVLPIVVAIILAFGSVNAKPKQQATEPKIVGSLDIKSVVEIRNGGEEILLNNEPVTLEQLGEAVKQTVDQIVTIATQDDISEEAIADVKNTLRESGITKVNYSKTATDAKDALRESGITKATYSKADGEIEQSDISVTINSDTQPEVVAEVKEALRESGVTKVNYCKTDTATETTTKTVKARNILIVDIKADGSVFIRGEQFTNDNKLKREVKKFIHNFRLLTINTRVLRIIRISGGRQYDKNSEFTTTAVKMGNGLCMACPVSKGIVSINSELPMGSPALESVSNTIYEAFMELREKMAHRIYNKSYNKLDEAQKAEVDKVVPIDISLALKE